MARICGSRCCSSNKIKQNKQEGSGNKLQPKTEDILRAGAASSVVKWGIPIQPTAVSRHHRHGSAVYGYGCNFVMGTTTGTCVYYPGCVCAFVLHKINVYLNCPRRVTSQVGSLCRFLNGTVMAVPLDSTTLSNHLGTGFQTQGSQDRQGRLPLVKSLLLS